MNTQYNQAQLGAEVLNLFIDLMRQYDANLLAPLDKSGFFGDFITKADCVQKQESEFYLHDGVTLPQLLFDFYATTEGEQRAQAKVATTLRLLLADTPFVVKTYLGGRLEYMVGGLQKSVESSEGIKLFWAKISRGITHELTEAQLMAIAATAPNNLLREHIEVLVLAAGQKARMQALLIR